MTVLLSCPALNTMSKTHKGAVLYGAKDLRIEDVATPSLQPHEIQIIPRATGVCGSDQHYYQNGRNGIYTVREPLILGHEAAGEVLAVGAEVTGFQPGDRVVIEPQLSCSACKPCRSGRYNLCQSMRFNGSASASPPQQGSLQKRLNHPARLCYKMPDGVSFEEGAIVEPLSVALHSVRKARLEAGQSVLITGAGAVGLLCAATARISGASHVTMVDVDEARLVFATQHKLADTVYQIPMSGAEGESPADFASRMAGDIRARMKTGSADAVFECTGVESCLNVSIGAAAPGAKIIQVGMGRPLQTVNLGVALVREIEVIGVWRYANTFQPAIELIEKGMIDVKPMITHRYPMEKLAEALELALSRPADLVKCIITSSD